MHRIDGSIEGTPSGGTACRGGAAGEAGRRGGPSNCLEFLGNTVSPPLEEDRGYRVKSCACRSRFCPGCCGWLGRDLREKLIKVLSTFQSVYMLTETVDPSNFPDDPESAFRYVTQRRCIARLVDRLYKLGHLHSRRYFVVVEWQGNGYPHWHILLDASFVPFSAITGVWDSFRPPWLGPAVGQRPPMGSSRFTKTWEGDDAGVRAGRYAAKYLTKHPADGYPQWVMQARYRIRRYSTSRGFWGDIGEPGRVAAEEEGADAEEGKGRQLVDQTIAQRVASCQQLCNIFRVAASVDPHTGELVERESWVCKTDRDIRAVAELIIDGIVENYYCIRVQRGIPSAWFGEWVDVWRGGRAAIERAEQARVSCGVE
jgi:hypothetical protein